MLSKVLRCAPLLEHLDVSHLDLRDQGLATMFRHGSFDLVSIMLTSTKLKGSGLQALTSAALPRLERLVLSRNPLGLDHLPGVVSALHGLKWFDLTACELGDTGARLVVRTVTDTAHTGTMTLVMALNGVTDDGIEIGRITSGGRLRLAGLDLSYNAISEAVATSLINAAEVIGTPP